MSNACLYAQASHWCHVTLEGFFESEISHDVSGWWWKVYFSWVCDLDPGTAWWVCSTIHAGMVSWNCFVSGAKVGGQRSQPSKPNHRVEGHRSSHGRFFRCPGQWDAWIPKETRKRQKEISICQHGLYTSGTRAHIYFYIHDMCYIPGMYTVVSSFGGDMDEVLNSKPEKQHAVSTKA